MRLICVVFFICVVFIEGLWSIKAKMQAKPPVVKRGGTVVLECTYELQGASLYTVKWYRGKHEFYKFTPKDIPQKKVFSTPHINVDQSYSNATQVMLRDMDLSVTGNFSCEVSAESSFTTVVVHTYVDVVSLPESGPTIRTERSRYNPGDVLKANCTTSPSKPAADLTFFINNEVMSLATKLIHKIDNSSLERPEVIMTEPLLDRHFRNGRLILKCTARVHPVFMNSASVTFNITSDPRPERITSAHSGGQRTSFHLFVLTIAFLICAVVSSEYDDYFYDSQDYDMDESMDKIRSMLLAS